MQNSQSFLSFLRGTAIGFSFLYSFGEKMNGQVNRNEPFKFK